MIWTSTQQEAMYVSDDGAAERWEYYITTLYADTHEQEQALAQLWPGATFPPFAPAALIPQLNSYGTDGWELVSLQAILQMGERGDIAITPVSQMDRWTNLYLCAFKRRKPHAT